MSNIRRKLINQIEESNIFSSAYLYCPYDKSLSTIDINNNISPISSSCTFTLNGAHFNGSNQKIVYQSENLKSIFSNDFTVFFEVIPENVYRNLYVLDIIELNHVAHKCGLFIYYTKNNKFSLTINDRPNSQVMDDEISGTNRVIYNSKYKICIIYKKTNKQYIYINGVHVATYTFNLSGNNSNNMTIGSHATRTDRYSKSTVTTVALWNKVLSNEECIKLTA